MPALRAPLLVLALSSAGCSQWPRYDHLPPADGAVPSTTDPRTLVQLSWTTVNEVERNDDPRDASETSLARSAGLVIHGSLDGTGWYDGAVAETFTDESCGSSGTIIPVEPGDYAADVDITRLDVADDGTLCARAIVGSDSHGWDLLLVEVDACGVPIGPVTGEDGGPLGVNLGGAEGGWWHDVTAGQRFAVVFAAYYPTDLDVDLAYSLGLSLLSPRDGDGEPVCPLLPDEEAE